MKNKLFPALLLFASFSGSLVAMENNNDEWTCEKKTYKCLGYGMMVCGVCMFCTSITHQNEVDSRYQNPADALWGIFGGGAFFATGTLMAALDCPQEKTKRKYGLIPSTARKITEHLRSTDLKHGHKEFRQQLKNAFDLGNDSFKKLDQKCLKQQEFKFLKKSTEKLTLEDINNLQRWCTEKESYLKNQWGEKCCTCIGLGCALCGFCLLDSDSLPNVDPVLQPTAQTKFIGTLIGIAGFCLCATGRKKADEKEKKLIELEKIKRDLLILRKINVNDKFPGTANQPSKKSTKSNKGKVKTE